MLPRWPLARLKAAELALDAGRIDDAYERIRSVDCRSGERERRICRELAIRLVARARMHAQRGDYAAALADLDRAQTIHAEDAATLALRETIQKAWRETLEARETRAALERRIQQNLDAGNLDSARRSADELPAAARQQVEAQVQDRARRVEEHLARAQAALARHDLESACAVLADGLRRFGNAPQLREGIAALRSRLAPAVGDALRGGQLARCAALLQAAHPLLELGAWALDDVAQPLRAAHEAAHLLSQREYGKLREQLARLSGLAQGPAWVNEALTVVERLLQAERELLASPLSQLAKSRPATSPAAAPLDARGALPSGGALIGRDGLLMLVDGGPSCVLLGGAQVRLGRGGSGTRVDVALQGRIQAHHADITHDGANYVLTAYGPVRVNQQPVQRCLLRSGDRIVLGEDVKLTFARPSPVSETAVLRLGSRNRLPLDVSQVVLFRETLLVGPSEGCHVQARDSRSCVVLFDRGGRLHARLRGATESADFAIQAGQTVQLGDVRLTVKPYVAQAARGGASA